MVASVAERAALFRPVVWKKPFEAAGEGVGSSADFGQCGGKNVCVSRGDGHRLRE